MTDKLNEAGPDRGKNGDCKSRNPMGKDIRLQTAKPSTRVKLRQGAGCKDKLENELDTKDKFSFLNNTFS
jgi:hypothetical protein